MVGQIMKLHEYQWKFMEFHGQFYLDLEDIALAEQEINWIPHFSN